MVSMKELLKRLIVEGWERELSYIPRDIVPKELVHAPISLALVGPRRAGKSYLLYQMAKERGGPYLYLNFEDERLIPFRTEHFDLILEAYYELREERPALFLDEIQVVPGWERFVRRLADNGYKVVVTGSNSSMVGKEVVERLGGRLVVVSVSPLSFREFLLFKGMEVGKELPYSKERFRVVKYFEEYLHFGGFPEVVLLSTREAKEKVLATYFDLVFYKDVMAREAVANEEALRFIVMKLRDSVGKVITPKRIYYLLKEHGVGVGPTTVERYLTYLEKAFLIFPVEPFSKSARRRFYRKWYFVDNGYLKLFEVKEDLGVLMENLLFTELMKAGRDVHYYRGKRECDFVVEGKALQVTYELTEENWEREVGGLIEAMETHRLREGVILTYSQEEEISVGGRRISVVPMWRWLLGALG